MANLIDLVKGHFTDELVERMGPFLGVDAAKAHQIADAVIPALLGVVTQKAGDGGVLELIQSFVGNGFDFGKVWSPAGGLVGLVEKGHPIVNSLFGDHLKDSVAAVAKAAGTSDHEARKALNLTAPGLLGTLASSLGAGVTGAGLAGLLDANNDSIAEKAGALGLPFDVKTGLAGLAGLMGVSAAASASEAPAVETPKAEEPKAAKRITVGNTDEVKEAVVAPVAAAAAAPVAAVAAASTKAVDVAEDAGHKIAAVAGNLPSVSAPAVKGSPLALMAILGLGLMGLVLLMKGCAAIPGGVAPEAPVVAAASEHEPKIEDPAMPVAPEVNAPAPDTTPAPDVKMDANVAADGVEAKLVEFIKSDKPVDKTTWFTFDRLYFDTAKASLKPESETQLKNIVEIMKAYPKVKLKIGGYTDNKGADAYNLKLSTDRANTTYHKLVGMGVAADRLAYEGYGKEHPIADNATEEGRAKNRRIDVRVTEK